MLKNDHTSFRVSDLDAAIRFYTEGLGLRLLFRKANPAVGEAIAFLELDGGNVELLQTLELPFKRPQVEPPYCPHLAIRTDDMGKTLEMIRAAGIAVVHGPLEIPGEEKWLYICDPDGNVIEFIEWASPPQADR
jgi:lactoylglutathione lyase